MYKIYLEKDLNNITQIVLTNIICIWFMNYNFFNFVMHIYNFAGSKRELLNNETQIYQLPL